MENLVFSVMAVINIPFAISGNKASWVNWIALGFCSGMGVMKIAMGN